MKSHKKYSLLLYLSYYRLEKNIGDNLFCGSLRFKMITHKLKLVQKNFFLTQGERHRSSFFSKIAPRTRSVDSSLCVNGLDTKEEPPSTAHRRGTLPSPASAAATELMLRAARVPPRGAAASLLEVLPRDEDDQLSARL